jgi:hypothetical protein
MRYVTEKSRASPTLEEVAQRYAVTNYLPPGAKRVYNPSVHPPTSVYRWLQLKDEIMHTPIYIISGHGVICNTPGQCLTPHILPADKPPEFTIPRSTYLINVTAGGEWCMFNSYLVSYIAQLRNEFIKMLLIDSKADIKVDYEAGIYPLLSQINRATEVEYPNFFCNFWDENPIERRCMGIFPLDKIADKKFVDINNIEDSLIQTMEPGFYNMRHWYLSELISETYKRTGTNSGIFIYTGCTTPYKDDGSNSTTATISHIQTLIYQGETRYSSIKPTLDTDTLKSNGFDAAIPTDVGTSNSIYAPSPTEIYAQGEAGMNLSEEARKENINAAKLLGWTNRWVKKPRASA